MFSDPELQRLLDEVKRTRVELRQVLGGRVATHTVDRTRARALAALEAYVATLQRRRLPIPRLVHRDLELLRATQGQGPLS